MSFVFVRRGVSLLGLLNRCARRDEQGCLLPVSPVPRLSRAVVVSGGALVRGEWSAVGTKEGLRGFRLPASL